MLKSPWENKKNMENQGNIKNIEIIGGNESNFLLEKRNPLHVTIEFAQ